MDTKHNNGTNQKEQRHEQHGDVSDAISLAI